MSAKLIRMSFVVTPELETALHSAKKEIFYNRNQSEMIRELLMAGIRAKTKEKLDAQRKARIMEEAL